MTDKFGRALGRSVAQVNIPSVTKSYIHDNFLESNVEEDIDMKDRFKCKNNPDPTEEGDVVTKRYFDNNAVNTNSNLNMNSNRIINCEQVQVLQEPFDHSHVIRKKDLKDHSIMRTDRENNMEGVMIKGAKQITLTNDPKNSSDVVTLGYLERFTKIIAETNKRNRIKTNTERLVFSNTTGQQLWKNWNLWTLSTNRAIDQLFLSSSTDTPSSGTGARILPPIGEYFAYFEASNESFNPSLEHQMRRQLEHIFSIEFYYHRAGRDQGLFKIEYQKEDGTWQVIKTLTGQEQTSENDPWSFCKISFEENDLYKEIQAISFTISGVKGPKADMCFSDIILHYVTFDE